MYSKLKIVKKNVQLASSIGSLFAAPIDVSQFNIFSKNYILICCKSIGSAKSWPNRCRENLKMFLMTGVVNSPSASIGSAKSDPIEEANWTFSLNYFKFAVHLLGQQKADPIDSKQIELFSLERMLNWCCSFYWGSKKWPNRSKPIENSQRLTILSFAVHLLGQQKVTQ